MLSWITVVREVSSNKIDSKVGCGWSETKSKLENTYWREIRKNPDGR